MTFYITRLFFQLWKVSDKKQKYYRGPKADFTTSYKKILDVLDMKKSNNYNTNIIVTKIDLDNDAGNENKTFLELFSDKDVYSYIKSQDNKWYFKEKETKNRSHYHNQYCEFPWTSLTVMADGSVVPCTQDYNLELKFGNVKESSLEEIWNSTKYKEFREMHITGKFPKGFKCVEKCDLRLIHDFL